MNVQIFDTSKQIYVSAFIEKAGKADLPGKGDSWNFDWKSLYKTEGGEVYKLSLVGEVKSIEGLLMLTFMNDEMLFMNNIEIAPYNLGRTGRYDNVAGCLIAFGCRKSFEVGKDNYEGFLTFESKTELIPLYVKKYGAIPIRGLTMFISPEAGKQLIQKYLEK